MDITKFKAVIFDLDGTLVDSMGMWIDIDAEYLARFDLPVPPHLQQDINGLRWSETAEYFQKRFHIEKSIEEIGQDWLDMAREQYRRRLPLKPGAREFISYLQDLKIPLGIASSNHPDLIEDFLEAHGLDGCFSTVITCEDVSAGKPDPSVYLTAARKLGAEPGECLVFEDIPNGILAGKRAGMTVCAVYDDYSVNAEDLKKTLADGWIRDYRELFDFGCL
ncbi:MAG TPA: HAD family phosphatase [Lachnospiraceae bacterium]|nr:HAD family phosphatase [Lachnospiraceae bacterium]